MTLLIKRIVGRNHAHRVTALWLLIAAAGAGLSVAPCYGQNTSDRRPTDWIFLVGKMPDAGLAAELKTRFGQLALNGKSGDRIMVFEAPEHRPTAHFQLPAGSGRRRLRDPALRMQLQQIADLLERMVDTQSAGQLGFAKIPETVWSVGNEAHRLRIILIGDPIYHDPQFGFWSMRNSCYPTDTALTSKRSSMPFRNLSRKPLPADAAFVFLTPKRWGDSQRHQDRVIRFYRLATQTQIGGQVERFTTDPAVVFLDSDGPTRGGLSARVVPNGDEIVGVWQLSRGGHVEVRPAEANAPADDHDERPETAAGSSPPPNDRSSGLPAVAPRHDQDATSASQLPAATVPAGRTLPVGTVTAPSTEPRSTSDFQRGESSVDGYVPQERSADSDVVPQPAIEPVHRAASAPPMTNAAAAVDVNESTRLPDSVAPGDAATSSPAVRGRDRETVETQRVPVPPAAAATVTQPAAMPSSDASATPPVSPKVPEPGAVDRPAANRERLRTLPPGLSLIARSVLEACQGETTLVVLSWTSECPHADLDLHIANGSSTELSEGNPVMPWGILYPSLSRSSELPLPHTSFKHLTEWALLSSEITDHVEIWINKFQTHKDVQCRVLCVSADSWKERRLTLSEAADQGANQHRRSDHPAWHLVQF